MADLEIKHGIRERRARFQRAILMSAKAVGFLGVAVFFPNALSALAHFGVLPASRRKETVSRSCERLMKAGYLESKAGRLRLTNKGECKLRQLELIDFRMSMPKRWDGKWRVLIFDIRENKRMLRCKVRRTLAAIGFVQLQKSVWAFPYDCEDLVVLLKADFRLGKELLYMIVDSIEHDLSLRRRFGLHHQG